MSSTLLDLTSYSQFTANENDNYALFQSLRIAWLHSYYLLVFSLRHTVAGAAFCVTVC